VDVEVFTGTVGVAVSMSFEEMEKVTFPPAPVKLASSM
jgi:hypothetical protein